MAKFTDLDLDQITKTLTPEQKATFQSQYIAEKKNRGTALALAIIPFVGHFGFARFYLGQTGLGILHIVLMIAFLIPGVIYWIVDMFLIGDAVEAYNREKARQIAVQVKSLG